MILLLWGQKLLNIYFVIKSLETYYNTTISNKFFKKGDMLLLDLLKTLTPKVLISLGASYIKDIITKFVQKIKKSPDPTPVTSTETKTVVETTTTTTTKTITKTHIVS